MINKKTLQRDSDFFNNLLILSQTYVEVSASRVQSVRRAVVGNRGFLSDLSRLYVQIKQSYHREIEKLSFQKNGRFNSGLPNNGKTAFVFIASNTGFYGDIVLRVFQSLIAKINSYKDTYDVIIIGKTGMNLWLQYCPNRPYLAFELPDNGIDVKQFKILVDSLIKYSKVFVSYGQFENIILQIPQVSDLTGDESVFANYGQEMKDKVEYFFEPDLKEIVSFFETEIFASLLVQTVDESQLSKNASRMVYMDKAGELIKDKIKKTHFAQQKIFHNSLNRKQRESLAGILFVSQ